MSKLDPRIQTLQSALALTAPSAEVCTLHTLLESTPFANTLLDEWIAETLESEEWQEDPRSWLRLQLLGALATGITAGRHSLAVFPSA